MLQLLITLRRNGRAYHQAPAGKVRQLINEGSSIYLSHFSLFVLYADAAPPHRSLRVHALSLCVNITETPPLW